MGDSSKVDSIVVEFFGNFGVYDFVGLYLLDDAIVDVIAVAVDGDVFVVEVGGGGGGCCW